jgi:hypothetical protein
MRLANMAYEELTEPMNRGWGTRYSTVGQLLQVERSGIEPLAADPKRTSGAMNRGRDTITGRAQPASRHWPPTAPASPRTSGNRRRSIEMLDRSADPLSRQ